MPLRPLLLRVLLWSLAAAAATGVAGILLASYTGVWRIAVTAVLTAGATALLLPLTLLFDRPVARASALLGSALVVTEYLLALLLTWVLSYAYVNHIGEAVALTMGFLASTALPAMVFLPLTHSRHTRIAAFAGLALCAAVFIVLMTGAAIVGAASSSSWQTYRLAEPWFVFGYLAGGIGLLTVVCLVGVGADPAPRRWRWAGVLAAAMAIGMVAVGVFGNVESGGEAFTCVLTLAALVAHANLIVRCPVKPGQSWLLYATIAATIATGLILDVIIIQEVDRTHPELFDAELLGRLAGAAGIVSGCGTLALAVLALLHRRASVAAAPPGPIRDIALTCPVCRTKQTLLVGDARCSSCGLIIHTRLEEPRCAQCDYSLLLLKSDRCPECGTSVPASNAATHAVGTAP